MAKLNIDWSELADTTVTTGAGATSDAADLSTAAGMLSAADRQYDRPILVYLTSSSDKDRTSQDVIEQTTLKDERVSISSKFFTMVQADGQQITKDHPYHRWLGGNKLPRFVAFTSDGVRTGKIEGRASPSKLYGLMKKTVAKDFVVNVDRTVKDYQKILTAIDRLSVLKSALDMKESRSDSKRDQKKISKERDELAQEEEELREQEEKLLDFKRRKAT